MEDPTIVNLSGKPYRLFVGVVHEAHEKGLQGVHVDLIQVPDEKNGMTAIVKATVRMPPTVDGGPERIFEDYGDANPRNCAQRVQTALIRMASTRAMGRAMRVAIDSAYTLAEELGDLPDEGGDGRQEAQPVRIQARGSTALPATGTYVCTAPGCGKALTKGQYDVSTKNFQQSLCPTHQSEVKEMLKKAEAEAEVAS